MFFLIITIFLFHPVPLFLDYRISSFKYVPYNEIIFILIIILSFFISFKKIFFYYVLKDEIVKVFLIFFFLFILGIFWSEDKYNSMIILKSISYFLLAPILLLTINKKLAKYLLIFLLSMSLLSALITNFIYFFNYKLELEIKLSTLSPFINHMYYGTILSICLSYFFINFKFNDKLFNILIKLLAFILLLTTIALISNRSSFFGLLVALSFYLWFKNNSFSFLKKISIILTTLFFIIFYCNLVNPNFGLKFLKLQNTLSNEISGERKGTSLGCRLNYIENSISVIKENPIFGVGTGDSLHFMKKYFGEKEYIDIVTKPCYLGPHNQIFYFDNHNMYLTMLMLFGPLGLIVFIYFLCKIYILGNFLGSWEMKLAIIIVSIASIPITLFYTSSNFILFFTFYICLLYITKKDYKINEID